MRSKLGIIASEFPPNIGGMEQHASGLAEALSDYYEVIVYTRAQHSHHCYERKVTVKAVLKADINADQDCLKNEGCAIWLILNAGYAPLARILHAPVFVYCHGNDFLNPWINSIDPKAERLLRKLRRLPFLWRFEHPLKKHLKRKKISRGLSMAKKVFVNSAYTKDRLSKEFPTVKMEIQVSHPGVSEAFFSAVGVKNVPTNKLTPIRLLTIARLATYARKKNVDNVIRALALLKAEIDFSYRVAGDGNLREQLEHLARELGISEQTRFLGNVENDEVVKYLDESDVLLLPSKASGEDVETFGIVYVEAAARGIPSLMSRAGGATDAVADGLSGVIIDGVEPEDIADGIRCFCKIRSAFDKADIKRFAEAFRWSNVAKELRDAMVETLNETNSRCSEMSAGAAKDSLSSSFSRGRST